MLSGLKPQPRRWRGRLLAVSDSWMTEWEQTESCSAISQVVCGSKNTPMSGPSHHSSPRDLLYLTWKHLLLGIKTWPTEGGVKAERSGVRRGLLTQSRPQQPDVGCWFYEECLFGARWWPWPQASTKTACQSWLRANLGTCLSGFWKEDYGWNRNVASADPSCQTWVRAASKTERYKSNRIKHSALPACKSWLRAKPQDEHDPACLSWMRAKSPHVQLIC